MRKADTNIAEKIVLRLIEDFSINPAKKYDDIELSKINIHHLGTPSLNEGDIVPFQHGSDVLEFVVVETIPEGTVVLDEGTQIQIIKSEIKSAEISFEHEKNVLGKFRQAEEAFLEQVQLGTAGCNKYETKYTFDYPKTFSALSELTSELKRFEEETENLHKILRKDPNDAHARYDLALRLHALGQYYDAENEFIRALRLAPSSAALHASYGNLLAEDRLGYSRPFAKKEYIEAVKLAPDNIEYRLALANFYLEIDPSYDKALETLQDIIKLKLDDARAYNLLGSLLSGGYSYHPHKNYAEALNYYKKYSELEPNDPAVHYSIGVVHCRLMRFKEAKEEFEKYLKHDPDLVKRPEEYAEDYIQNARLQMEIESKDNCPSCDIDRGRC